jgi:hypothetical protein
MKPGLELRRPRQLRSETHMTALGQFHFRSGRLTFNTVPRQGSDMNAQFARGRQSTDGDARTAVDVSDVETERVEAHVREWFPDVEVYLERKGGRTFLVAGA